MNNVLHSISKLSKNERDDLYRFLEYAAAGKRQLLLLSKHLLEAIQDGSPFLNPKEIHISDIKANRIPQLLTQFSNFFAQYLAHLECKESPGMEQILALRQMRKRNLGWSPVQEKKVHQELDHWGEDAWQYLMRYWLEREKMEEEAEGRNRGKKMEWSRRFLYLDFLINRFFALSKAQQNVEKAALKQVKKVRQEGPGTADHIEKMADSFLESMSPGWTLLLFYKELDDEKWTPESFASLCNALKGLKAEVSSPQWQDLWAQLHNMAAKLVNMGEKGIGDHVMDLFELGFESGLEVSKGGVLRPAFVKNFTEMACRLDRVDRAGQMLAELEINPVFDNEPIFVFCKAIIAFHKGEFEAAAQLLNALQFKEDFSDLYFQMGLRFLEAKTHYELEGYDMVIQILSRLKQFVRENLQMPQYHRDILKERINVFFRLLNLREGSRPKQERLLSDLQASKVEDREWFLKKVKEIGADA